MEAITRITHLINISDTTITAKSSQAELQKAASIELKQCQIFKSLHFYASQPPALFPLGICMPFYVFYFFQAALTFLRSILLKGLKIYWKIKPVFNY